MAEKEVKLQISEALWKRAKVAAATQEITLKELCTKAIKEEVEFIEQHSIQRLN